jgi:NADPH:quinone reductase-like Zn-dependent oxidoreductase
MKAIRMESYGGPEVLQLRDLDSPEPGRGQVRVRLRAAGLNFVDIYQRIIHIFHFICLCVFCNFVFFVVNPQTRGM